MFKKMLILATTCWAFTGISVAIASGDADAGKAKSAICASCHGVDGVSAIPINPSLAGQVPGYVSAQLAAFKSGERANAIMQGQVTMLTRQDMDDLDAYYASLPARITSSFSEAELEMAAEGERIYRGGFSERGISACKSCHGPSGHGIPKNYPRVAAQSKEYLEQQLLAYKKGERQGFNNIMSDIAFGLSEQQIKQLSIYMAGLR